MFAKKKKTLKKSSKLQKEEHKETKQGDKDKISKQRHTIKLLVQQQKIQISDCEGC